VRARARACMDIHTDFRDFDKKKRQSAPQKPSFCELKNFFIFRSHSRPVRRHAIIRTESHMTELEL